MKTNNKVSNKKQKLSKTKIMKSAKYECSCCNETDEFDMDCSENKYFKMIDKKMKYWNKLNPSNTMTYNNTIITPIRPYESFISDTKYNLKIDNDDCICFDDNMKTLLKDYYHYTNYQPYFYYLDYKTEKLVKDGFCPDENCKSCTYEFLNYCNKTHNNKWNDGDTDYWKNNIYKNTEFNDIYVNVCM